MSEAKYMEQEQMDEQYFEESTDIIEEYWVKYRDNGQIAVGNNIMCPVCLKELKKKNISAEILFNKM